MPQHPEAIRRYKAQIAAYRTRTSAVLASNWDRLPAYDRANIDAYLKATAAPLAGAKRAAVSLSAAFFALSMKVPTVGVNPNDITPRVNLEGPFLAMWHAFSEGRPYDEALAAGRSMAEANGFQFVQSASRLTGDFVAAASGREVRWQRVPGPNACAWCIDVARDDYVSSESADFGHDHDDCDVMPA